MTAQQAEELIKELKEIKGLIRVLPSKIDANDSRTMEMIGNVSDKLDRMWPEESDLSVDSKDF